MKVVSEPKRTFAGLRIIRKADRQKAMSSNRWLEAHFDRNTNLYVLPHQAILTDSAGDGDQRLILVDAKLFATDSTHQARLKTYKGNMLVADQNLPDVPCGLISFYMDRNEPRVPTIGVACASQLLLYKNGKPYFKFSLPPEEATPLEVEVWRQLLNQPPDLDQYRKLIEDLRTIPLANLSSRSQHLIQLQEKSHGDLLEFIGQCPTKTPLRTTIITCVTTLDRTIPTTLEDLPPMCPVLATESGDVLILDPKQFTVLRQANISPITKRTPSCIKATGSYDVSFSIVIGCRENSVCVLQRDWLEGKILFQLNENLIDLLLTPGEERIVVGTVAKMIYCYNKSGLRLWSIQMPEPITCLCLVPLHHLSTYFIAIGLNNGTIQMFSGRKLVDSLFVTDAPSAMVFGRLGQEDNVLIVITIDGSLYIKILKRTADFNLHRLGSSSLSVPDAKPLPLPKKGPIFAELSRKEREDSIGIHRIFQQDLIKMRLKAAKTLVETLNIQSKNAFGAEQEIRLTAQILGFGPTFTLTLTIENMKADKALTGYLVIFHVNPSLYTIVPHILTVPLIPPVFSYKMRASVTQIQYQNEDGTLILAENSIRIFVKKKGLNEAAVVASITIPTTQFID